MLISTPEATALDLVTFPEYSGGLSNICTVLGEMLEEKIVDLVVLADVAQGYPSAVRQRAGWLLGRAAAYLDITVDLTGLRTASTLRAVPAVLNPSRPRRGGTFDESWNLIINADVEPDL
jgi:predicted transcriptional regulator of viral defense system